jgi:hypothetical protein
LRERKALSQDNIEKRTGLLRCYISPITWGFVFPTQNDANNFAEFIQQKAKLDGAGVAR